MFPEFFEDPPDSFYVTLAGVFGVNQNVIEVHNDKNIKFFHQDFVDVSLEAGGGIRKTEKHDLILKMAILRLECYFPLVTLPNFHLIICVYQVQPSKTLSAT